MQETWVWSLGQEGPLEKEWQSTPVFLPGKSHGWRSLIGYSPWGRKESDATERLRFTNSTVCFCEWMTRPAWSSWGALLCGSVVMSYGLWQKPVGVYTDLPMPSGTQCLLRGPTRNRQSVRPELSFLGQTFRSLWLCHNFLGIRTTNLSNHRLSRDLWSMLLLCTVT